MKHFQNTLKPRLNHQKIKTSLRISFAGFILAGASMFAISKTSDTTEELASSIKIVQPSYYAACTQQITAEFPTQEARQAFDTQKEELGAALKQLNAVKRKSEDLTKLACKLLILGSLIGFGGALFGGLHVINTRRKEIIFDLKRNEPREK